MKRPQIGAVVRGARQALRWRYVLPRVVIAAALIGAVRFGLDPLLRFAIIASGEAATGAKVEVASVSTSLLDGRIVIEGFAAANPQKPLKNLAEAEQVRLDIDMAALARKRLVVRNGLVRGVQFDSERTTSGALSPTDEPTGPSVLDPVVTAASEAAGEWLDALRGRVEGDLESKLATPRVVRELQERWEAQYAALKTKTDDLRAQAKQIERDIREVKKNPLRGLEQLDTLQKRLAATQAELKTTLAELQALPAQAAADRAAIDAARKQDELFIRDSLKLAAGDSGKLTEYLLGDTAHGYIADSIGWVQYVRSWIPQSKMERPARARGTNVLFVDRQLPKLLIDRVALTGTGRLNGQPLEVTGLLTDATTEPRLHERPLQMHMVASGSAGGELLVTVDRRTDVSRDTLVLDVPHLLLGERTLGKADSLAVNVAPGEASIVADIVLQGEQLSGFIHLRQASSLAASTPALRDDRIAGMIAESLRGVDRLEARIELAGTLKKPKWTIDSELGAQLAQGVNAAARRYVTERRDRLMAKVQGTVDEQLAKLEARRSEAQQELLGKLGEDQQLMTQLTSLLGGGNPLGGLSVPQLGKAVPLDKLQR